MQGMWLQVGILALTISSSRPTTRRTFCGGRCAPFCHKMHAALRAA